VKETKQTEFWFLLVSFGFFGFFIFWPGEHHGRGPPIDSHNESNIAVQVCYEDIYRLTIRRIAGENGVSIGQDAAKMVVSGATE